MSSETPLSLTTEQMMLQPWTRAHSCPIHPAQCPSLQTSVACGTQPFPWLVCSLAATLISALHLQGEKACVRAPACRVFAPRERPGKGQLGPPPPPSLTEALTLIYRTGQLWPSACRQWLPRSGAAATSPNCPPCSPPRHPTIWASRTSQQMRN